jgi:hypothetical protein
MSPTVYTIELGHELLLKRKTKETFLYSPSELGQINR